MVAICSELRHPVVRIPGKEKGSKDNIREVDVEFDANGPGKKIDATIGDRRRNRWCPGWRTWRHCGA
jgi:hypothetical protein